MPPFSDSQDPVGIGLDSENPYCPTDKINGSGKHDVDANPEPDECALESPLGFDPCGGFDMYGIFCSVPSPGSAIFKTRTCFECGHNCSKFEGYEKKLIFKRVGHNDEEEPLGTAKVVETEIYFHNWCLQVHKWRISHAKTYNKVMIELLKRVHSRNVIARFARRARERRREKALNTRDVVVPVKKEEKAKGATRLLSFFSKKQKTTIDSSTPSNDVSDKAPEKVVNKRTKKNYFIPKKRKAPSNEVSDEVPEKTENESAKKSSLFSKKQKTSSNSSAPSKEESDETPEKQVNGAKKFSFFSKKEKATSTPTTEASDEASEKKVNDEGAASSEKKKPAFFAGRFAKKNWNKRNPKGAKPVQSEDSTAKQDNTSKPSEAKKPASFAGRFAMYKSGVPKIQPIATVETPVKRGKKKRASKKKKPFDELSGMRPRTSLRIDNFEETSTIASANAKENKLKKKSPLKNPFRRIERPISI